IAFGLILNPQGLYTPRPTWNETNKYSCQIQIATHMMQAIMEFGCLHPCCYELYTNNLLKEKIGPPALEQLWNSTEGKSFSAIRNHFASSNCIQPGTNTPIVVYDKNRTPVALPKGATALDFAFTLDSRTGDHATDVIINNR